MIFKNKKGNIIYFIILILVGVLWITTYNSTDEYIMYRYNDNGGVDSSNMYRVAPRYTKKLIMNDDTVYLYFNKDREAVIKLKKSELKYYVIKK